MNKTIVHHEGAAALTVAGPNLKSTPGTIKLGVDVHGRFYVVAVQHDHALPKPARRFAPQEFVPWVKTLLGPDTRSTSFMRRAALASGSTGN